MTHSIIILMKCVWISVSQSNFLIWKGKFNQKQQALCTLTMDKTRIMYMRPHRELMSPLIKSWTQRLPSRHSMINSFSPFPKRTKMIKQKEKKNKKKTKGPTEQKHMIYQLVAPMPLCPPFPQTLTSPSCFFRWTRPLGDDLCLRNSSVRPFFRL